MLAIDALNHAGAIAGNNATLTGNAKGLASLIPRGLGSTITALVVVNPISRATAARAMRLTIGQHR